MADQKYSNRDIKQQKQMNFPIKVALIGFFGGLFWSLIGYFSYYFSFTKIGPAFVLMPWALGEWKTGHLGQVLGVLVLAILSIAVAFLYKFCFQKINSMWVGVGVGILLWIIVFYIINPFVPQLKPVQSYDWHTLVTSLCLYVLYGLFIGYSISYEYAEQKY
ncbi:YqhR family membrane protein [Shouchella shacheensis]|uniref:YqhR family membrane protein n=1 Tax=Shouchella shacheensis TaxID=1649580 RepID=UPI00073FEA81|nr:YqhR family membrane protein [Shouchella shacheensis]